MGRPRRHRRSGSASAQKKGANHNPKKRKMFPVMQWKKLLIVIHNSGQEYSLGIAALENSMRGRRHARATAGK
jgi:hypothetical protein